MTRDEELQRYYEERNMLESDIEVETDKMTRIERDNPDYENDPEWNVCWDFVNSSENEVTCLNNWIDEVEE